MHRTPALALLLASGTALAADDFSRLAPPDAGLVVSVANYATAKQLLLATPLGRLTQTPDIAAAIEEARKQRMESFEALTTELGIDVEEWPEPAGMLGLALIARPIPDAEEWAPQFDQLFVVAADFGDRITEVQAILDAVVDQGLDQGLIDVQIDNVGDVEVITITVIPEVDDPDAPQPGDPLDEAPAGLRGMLAGLDTAAIAIQDSTLYVGAETALVMDMLDRARGSDIRSIADDVQFAASLAQHPDNSSDYAVLFPGRMGFLEGLITGMLIPPPLDAVQILTDLGITNMKAVSLAADLQPADDAQVEFTLGILDPEKSGLVSLFDLTDGPWNPPAFVTPDAFAATRLLVDFPRLPEVAREFFTTLPPELQDQAAFAFEQAMGFVDTIAPLVGPEVYLIQTLERPFAAAPTQVFAIPTSDQLPISNLLVLASQGGLNPRDFGGTKIYDDPSGALSLAVAYGHFFVGSPTAVESALRLASADAGDSLAGDPAFQSAMRPHDSTGNALQFTRLLDLLDYTIWAAQNIREIQNQALRDAGWSEDDIAQFVPPDTTPQWLKDLSIETLAPALGDVSMEITPSDDGFRGRILLHNPK